MIYIEDQRDETTVVQNSFITKVSKISEDIYIFLDRGYKIVMSSDNLDLIVKSIKEQPK